MALVTTKGVLFIKVSLLQGVLIKGVLLYTFLYAKGRITELNSFSYLRTAESSEGAAGVGEETDCLSERLERGRAEDEAPGHM